MFFFFSLFFLFQVNIISFFGSFFYVLSAPLEIMVEIFRKTTNTPRWYFTKEYKSPLKYQKGEYIVKKLPKKTKPDSDALALMQKLRENEQEKSNSTKTKKKRTRR